jgi:choline monooxygenase
MKTSALDKQIGDEPFTTDPAKSFTMPARYYTDDSVYEAEKEAIFYNSWWYAGHVSQAAEAGQYLTTQIHEQNIFVIRDKDGELHAHYNVCQHRGHELLSGQGRTNLIVCPYHAWSYNADGSLKAARNSQNVGGFNKCDFALKSVRVEVFCGMVFINLDPDAIALKEQAADLEKEIRDICPSVDDLVFAQRDPYHVPCNWKVMVDNFLECYHCQPAHKDFVDLVDMPSYRSKTGKIYSSHVSMGIPDSNNKAFNLGDTSDLEFGYAAWFLWPNLTIWAYPGEPNLSILQMIPDGAGNTVEYQDWFLPTEIPSPQLKEAMDYQKDVLQPEDVSLCVSVQRGLKSKGYNQGRFMVDSERSELSEHAVHHFQALVVNALGGLSDGNG